MLHSVRFFANGRAGGFENAVVADANSDGSLNLHVFRKLGVYALPGDGPRTNVYEPPKPPKALRPELNVLPFYEGAEGKPGNTVRFYEPAN